MTELERPDGVGGRNVKRPVAGDARRPGVTGDRIADQRGPALDELGETRLRTETR
jgi:hypothetical protein